MPTNNEIPTHLNMRIDPKLRYLADLAARATGVSLTDYIEAAIWQSFAKVSLDQLPMPEGGEEPNYLTLSPTERQARFRKRASVVTNPLSDVGDRLWSEHPFARIQLLVVAGFDHLLGDEERRIWDYAFSRFTKEGKLNTKAVIQNWLAVTTEATKAKAKGRK
jgi:hypothetical protein